LAGLPDLGTCDATANNAKPAAKDTVTASVDKTRSFFQLRRLNLLGTLFGLAIEIDVYKKK
jgi:hypothetical protein